MAAWWKTVLEFTQENVFGNWHYKMVALLAATILWAYVASQQTMQVVFTVPIRFQNIPAGSRLADQRVDVAEVTLAGRREQVLAVKQRQIWVSLDLSGLRNGRNLYLISARDVVVPPGLEVKDITPRQLSIQLAAETVSP